MPRGHLALTRRSEMGRGRPANTKLSPRATVAVTSRHKSHIWEPHARAPAARPSDPPRPPALAELARTLAHAARGRRGPLTLTPTASRGDYHFGAKVTSENHTRALQLSERRRARPPPPPPARPTRRARPRSLSWRSRSRTPHADAGAL